MSIDVYARQLSTGTNLGGPALHHPEGSRRGRGRMSLSLPSQPVSQADPEMQTTSGLASRWLHSSLQSREAAWRRKGQEGVGMQLKRRLVWDEAKG